MGSWFQSSGESSSQKTHDSISVLSDIFFINNLGFINENAVNLKLHFSYFQLGNENKWFIN